MSIFLLYLLLHHHLVHQLFGFKQKQKHEKKQKINHQKKSLLSLAVMKLKYEKHTDMRV